MASNEDRYNDTECPVCMETFKDPKQLPCTHTYCLQCIEKIVGRRNSFACPECQRDTAVPSNGLQAIPDNRYIQAILRVTEQAKKLKQEKLQAEKLLEVKLQEDKIKEEMGQQSEQICTTHKQLLLLYCNDSCQQIICTTCGLVKHKGHEIVDIAEKYAEIRNHIKEVINDAEHLTDKYDCYLNKLEEAEKEVKETTKITIDQIDQRQEEFIKQIKDTTESQKLEVLQIEEENVNKIQIAKVKLMGFRELLRDFSTNSQSDIDRTSMQELLTSRNDPADTLSTIKLGIFNENVNIGIEKVTYQPLDIASQLKLDYVGRIEKKMIYIQSGLTPQICFKHKWNIDHYISCVAYSKDKDLLLVLGWSNGRNIIKCFTNKGQELWQLDPSKDVCGHAVVSDGIEYLIVVREHKIELHGLVDGAVLDTIDISFDAGHYGVCAVGEKSFLVVNSSAEPYSLAEFEVRDGRLVDKNLVINTDLCDITGLYYCSERGEVCLISRSKNTIEAIDYATHDIKWRITGEYEGTEIQPLGVTGDRRGNLYVSDCFNGRILSLRDGRVITVLQLDDCPYSIEDLCCIPSFNHENPQLFVILLNSIEDLYESIIHVYQINYEFMNKQNE